MAICYSGIHVELREVVLRDKPASMLEYSPKGEVPVLVLADGNVIDESIDIAYWALAQNDPDHWLADDVGQQEQTYQLIEENDFVFKVYLDKYKYAERHPEHPADYYRARGEDFLQKLEGRLLKNNYLLGKRLSIADIAVFPFIRQFAFADKHWFDQSDYRQLQQWLASLLQSRLFLDIMCKYPQWHPGDNIAIFP